MHLYFIRHGETEFNRLGIAQGSGVDSDLNEIGRRQAAAFYEYYHQEPFDLVVTSALKRTHQTAAGFLEKGLPWVIKPEINEINWGHNEGKPHTAESTAIYRNVIGEWQKGNFQAAFPGGESAAALGARLSMFIDWLHTRPANHLLVVSHGRTMRALITLLKGKALTEMEGVPHANTACYSARLNEGKFEFIMENDLRHLDEKPEIIY